MRKLVLIGVVLGVGLLAMDWLWCRYRALPVAISSAALRSVSELELALGRPSERITERARDLDPSRYGRIRLPHEKVKELGDSKVQVLYWKRSCILGSHEFLAIAATDRANGVNRDHIVFYASSGSWWRGPVWIVDEVKASAG